VFIVAAFQKYPGKPWTGTFKQSGTLNMRNLLHRFLDDQSGVTAIEYGLIASLIAVVIITAVKLVGTDLTATFNAIAANLA
jgi:pilus assembly protein Flp/PilA